MNIANLSDLQTNQQLESHTQSIYNDYEIEKQNKIDNYNFEIDALEAQREEYLELLEYLKEQKLYSDVTRVKNRIEDIEDEIADIESKIEIL